MTWKPKHPCRLAGAIGAMLCMQLAAAQSLDDIYKAGKDRIEQAQAAQEQIDKIVEKTQGDFEDYQILQREIEDLKVFNNLLQAQVDAQNRKLDQLYKSIDEAGSIEHQILPLMQRMTDGLDRFIDLGTPFLVKERKERVEGLRVLLRRADVTAAEQFRKVLQAWQLEMSDYATQGDTYTDEVKMPDGVTREVDLLRIGRVALLYVTPDNSQAGAWDQRSRKWVPLDAESAKEIRIGINAYQTEQPEMFMAPVAPPEE